MPAATDELIRRMYEAPPDGFVAARSAAIADAKKAGDKDTVKRLTALRKPTVAAWLVNLLALRRPELIDELVELATALREAQRGLKGDEMRELSNQRRQIVSALVTEARKLAVAEDAVDDRRQAAARRGGVHPDRGAGRAGDRRAGPHRAADPGGHLRRASARSRAPGCG